MNRLTNKVALITGAASGMGAAAARLFAQEGARVLATDIQADLLAQVVHGITAAGGQALALRHDVTSEADWAAVVAQGVQAFGKIDILLNNAGIISEVSSMQMENITLAAWNKLLGVNATGNFLGIQAVVPEMKKVGQGSIVNVSSITGLVGGAAGLHYSASKGATRLLAKTAAVQLGKFNIRVNSIHPGVIETPMVASQRALPGASEGMQAFLATLPLGRGGTADEVANLLLFLASDEASYITGAEIAIDGGFTAQ